MMKLFLKIIWLQLLDEQAKKLKGFAITSIFGLPLLTEVLTDTLCPPFTLGAADPLRSTNPLGAADPLRSTNPLGAADPLRSMNPLDATDPLGLRAKFGLYSDKVLKAGPYGTNPNSDCTGLNGTRGTRTRD